MVGQVLNRIGKGRLINRIEELLVWYGNVAN